VAVRDLVHYRIVHKAKESGAVAHNINFLFGEILFQNMFQTQLAAHGISVGLFVPVEDDAVKAADLLHNGFKQGVFLPFV
jgi:hypothetical protein